ncbi:MAG: hypothetical protein JNM93_02935 [Bacteriovoracaceae bacterium]|nr:hypothetical protein [Bacteriovoracaceae bacterium]
MISRPAILLTILVLLFISLRTRAAGEREFTKIAAGEREVGKMRCLFMPY